MDELVQVGFDRPKPEPLPGTVKFYQRHAFACTGEAGWPAHIERDGGFCQELAEAVDARARDLAQAVKLTACDEPSHGGGTDLMLFPDMIRYIGLGADDLRVLVDDHLVGNKPSQRLAHEPIGGWHIFACVHEARDARCGFCGPVLAGLLRDEVARRDLGDRVHVHRMSHVGGHQYAGNVILYPGGDWYGYVTPADVPRIVEQHVLRGQVLEDLWRGRMGLTREEQLAWIAARPPG